MAKFPRVGSTGCILLVVEISFLVLPGIALIILGALRIVGGELGWSLVCFGIGIFVLLFGLACIRETFDRDSYDAMRLPRDLNEMIRLTPREQKLLTKVRRDIDDAPSQENVLEILKSGGPGAITPANSELMPIAFAFKPTTPQRYVKGVLLELLTWSALLVSAPLLLLIAVLSNAFIAWDIGKGVLRKAMTSSRNARRYRIRPHNLFRHDERSPVLYLRAFSEEYSDKLEGFFLKTPEELLADHYNQSGPMIAVGNPEEEIPLLGASRIYFDDSTWKAGILYLMSVSQLVIIHAGFAEGLLWELGVAHKNVRPDRLLICFAAWADIDPKVRHFHYLRFKNYVAEILSLNLPEEIGKHLYIGFDENWIPTLR